MVAYPTEAVFGLGCNPNNESGERALFKLKTRSQEKGLILIAPTKELLLPYIDENTSTTLRRQNYSPHGPHPIIWVLPS
ncbi:Sua5/YciO/YrdC/YwlC family protein [Actinobacillus pleuropneumoniae]|uniref:Sua5/YciO/YrdC/YwlC family protein n=1 Tax=Actinobacillus pleuropneumoniae TaxID=715 RepID=UPI00030A2ED4|nr:Sua5/YciO/YrdC/YwlC family protein [Actinobacillus pleuropneumoniae]